MMTKDLSVSSNSAYVRKWKDENPDKVKLYKKTDLERNGEKRRKKRRENYRRWKDDGRVLKWRLSKFDLTPEQFAELAKKGCGICGTHDWGTRNGKPILPSVDHCHKTGKWRGLLCLRCNKSIGAFGDDIQLLRAALTYLEKFNEVLPL